MDPSKYQVGYYPVEKKYNKDAGYRTSDITNEGMTLVGCKECGDLIVKFLEKG